MSYTPPSTFLTKTVYDPQNKQADAFALSNHTGLAAPRVQSVVSATTITPNADADDAVNITAIAVNFTMANPTGSPVNFQKLVVRIKDNGVARTITWGTAYVPMGTALPTITVINKILTHGFVYDSTNSKWGLVALTTEV